MKEQVKYDYEENSTFDSNAIVSVQEVQSYLGNIHITVDQAEGLRDDLIGILDNIINSYLTEFK